MGQIVDHLRSFILIILTCFLAASCASNKNIIYFQDIEQASLDNLMTDYEAVIKKDDRLSILVSGPDKSVCAPYNLTLNEGNYGAGSYSIDNSTITYLVDCNGCIDFPILGIIHVEGMTRHELTDSLTRRIGVDVKDPIVSVSFKNYRITVLGEVRNPGTYTMSSEKNSILQALGAAGDLNLTAKRDGILLFREVEGKMMHYSIDLKKSDVFNSPYFYLQQNDVIYVPANATRIANANNVSSILGLVFSSMTSIIAIISFILVL